MQQRAREWREEDWEHERSRSWQREPGQREAWGRGPSRESSHMEPWNEPRGGQGEWRTDEDPRGREWGPQGQRSGPYYGQHESFSQGAYGGGRSGYSGGSGGGGRRQEDWHDNPYSAPPYSAPPYSAPPYSAPPYSSGPHYQQQGGGYPQYGSGMEGDFGRSSHRGQQQRSANPYPSPYVVPYREQGSYREEQRRGEGFMPQSQDWNRSGQEWSGRIGGGFESGYGGMRQVSGMTSATGASRRSVRGPKGYQRSDDRIREDVCDRLIAADVECDEIEIKVKDGEVTLLGTTRSGESRREIERLAESVSGVKDVTNQIRMKRDTEDGDPRRESSGGSQQSSSQQASSAQGRSSQSAQTGSTQGRTG